MRNTPLSHAGRWMLDRRHFLAHGGTGLAGVALAALLAQERSATAAPPAWKITAKAKRVLVIFCSGAVSHVDSFDYKPELIRRAGQPLPGKDKLVTFQGENGNLTAPLWTFKPRGKSGKMISDLFPKVADLADDLTFIHSMTAKSNTHGPAENQMSTGYTLDGFPSMGAWVSYALGASNADLPAFVAIPDPRGVPQTGPNNWGSGFLPASAQGTAFTADKPIPHLLRPSSIPADSDAASRDLLKMLNDRHLARHPGDTDLMGRIASYELAARMQLKAVEVGDLSKETREVHQLYGTNDPNPTKAGFARNCLLARRLLERDVRFVQLFNGSYAMGEGVGNWDGHKTLAKQYAIHREIFDQPCAALIRDLKRTGLLKDTVVAWVTEFGRMPTFQKGASGRDHNPHGFTVWLTGAGVKPGISHGATDEFGHKAIEDECTIYDLHATLLHLLGIDHEQLTFYHNGIARRLTDVHGELVEPILA